MFAIALILPAPVTADAASILQAQAACVAPIGSRPLLPGVHVTPEPAATGDLPRLRITDESTGNWLYVYHDTMSERAAWARAACIGAQLRLLGQEFPAFSRATQWSSAAFTTDKTLVVPPGGTVVRWHIPVDATGGLTASGQQMIVITLPHEQVHRFQGRADARLPRWVAEGHAEWVGRRISLAIAPAAQHAVARASASALDAARGPIDLKNWGGFRPTRQAIMRQVTATEQERMKDDPEYMPSLEGRSLRFGPGDFTSDERLTKPRYEAAWRIFRDLEVKYGPAAVRGWVDRLSAAAGPVASATVLEQAREAFDEDLARRLD